MSDHKYIDGVLNYVPNANQIEETYKDKEKCIEDGTKHFVMWSGGTDSTLLLYELIMTYGAENVVAISYKYPWLDSMKFSNETQHREAFKAKMRIRGLPEVNHELLEMNLMTSGPYNFDTRQNRGLPQAVAWLLSVPIYIPDNCYVYDGGIREDDLTLVLHKYHDMFRDICGVLNKKITLREPYLMFSKAQILEKLFEYDLYEETWTCEMPQHMHTPCMNCTPCNTHIAALNEVIFSTKDELIRLKAQKEFERLMKIRFPDGNISTNNGVEFGENKE